MQKTGSVDIGHRLRHSQSDFGSGPRINGQSGFALSEILSIDVFEDQANRFSETDHVIDPDDMFMIERSQRVRFASEPLAQFLLILFGTIDHLNGDKPFDAQLNGLINDPHPASADFHYDFIAGNLREIGPGKCFNGTRIVRTSFCRMVDHQTVHRRQHFDPSL